MEPQSRGWEPRDVYCWPRARDLQADNGDGTVDTKHVAQYGCHFFTEEGGGGDGMFHGSEKPGTSGAADTVSHKAHSTGLGSVPLTWAHLTCRVFGATKLLEEEGLCGFVLCHENNPGLEM